MLLLTTVFPITAFLAPLWTAREQVSNSHGEKVVWVFNQPATGVTIRAGRSLIVSKGHLI